MHRSGRTPARAGCASSAARPTSCVITTNYDTALERAFDAVHEPYDLVVFVGDGASTAAGSCTSLVGPGRPRRRGRSRCPTSTWTSPSTKTGSSSGRSSSSSTAAPRTSGAGWPTLRDNFVVTEDDYIGYLTQSPVESLIPLQILNKIRDSHFLFLGYRMRDWSVRVFLQRVWGEHPLEARSWAVDPAPDPVERELWEHFGVKVVDEPLTEFLDELERELARLAPWTRSGERPTRRTSAWTTSSRRMPASSSAATPSASGSSAISGRRG